MQDTKLKDRFSNWKKQRFLYDKDERNFEKPETSRSVKFSRNYSPLHLAEAEKIVNEYGHALQQANRINGNKMQRLLKNLKGNQRLMREVAENLNSEKGAYYDLFSQKADRSLLPYPKERIKAAIELLLEHDKDPGNINLLKAGLHYLNYFA